MLFYRHDASPSPSKGYINIRVTARFIDKFLEGGGWGAKCAEPAYRSRALNDRGLNTQHIECSILV